MRPVKHFSLDRINGTELRTIADVDDGVIQLMQCEETVIRKYEQARLWRHRRVMFFILHDLQPLMRQVQSRPGMTASRIADIQNQPATVLYDLKSLDECSVYVNRQASERAGYWHDLTAMQGLLVHEHAHPVAENDTVRASRQLSLELTGEGDERLDHVMNDLARMLSLYAPRELFANETALRAGFGDVMLHLDQRLITDASHSLSGRATLLQQLGDAVSRQVMTQATAKVLLLAGDLQMCLPLAIEVAPFYRAESRQFAHQLDTLLTTTLFPALGPQVEHTYRALCNAYIGLSPDQTVDALTKWCTSVLAIIADSLAQSGYALQFRLLKDGDLRYDR
jgi:hypothetical protein